MTEPRIKLAEVEHVYEGRSGAVQALGRTDLTVQPGEFVSVVGASGCGKTTLLRIVAGFVRASTGSVEIDGEQVTGPAPERGVVFQRPSLYPWLSVAGNVEFGLKMRRVPRKARRETARRYLDLVGLGDFADAAPYELSGGMQQRCQIARVLATEPSTVLMDEPFGALDALTREKLQGELRSIWAAEQRTVLFVTHSVEEAVLLSTRVLVMSPRPGRVILDLPIESDPADDLATLRTSPAVLAAAEKVRAAVTSGPA
ncbi:ABC transporter ATP-binding protein [Cryptosporangium aurantiacum]|uniref:NitT/TauT family transport system ATP-binding protein/taurine transport system ATP-binding protein n=1 Tax=Cryptosporangium aurantiacum TaxID=134849 RepID=A0A1M7RM63_9ACTN|nr:ABC transporter ATP-binding protein [Cryptosporangium aurantiacum]SHN47425.1 NitT/TauT family transport system ATP-binding protein/taurine transport system ATP-binding protein [Cryptosporangium aurantiacum]